MVTRPRLLGTSFRVCVVAVVALFLLALALVLPTRVVTAAAIVFVSLLLFEGEGWSSQRYGVLRACQRRYASPSSRSWSRSGL